MRKIAGLLTLIFGLTYLAYSSVFFLIFPIGLLIPSIMKGIAWNYLSVLVYAGYVSGAFSVIFGLVMLILGQEENRKDLSIGSLFVLIQGLLIALFVHSIATVPAEPGPKEIARFSTQ